MLLPKVGAIQLGFDFGCVFPLLGEFGDAIGTEFKHERRGD